MKIPCIFSLFIGLAVLVPAETHAQNAPNKNYSRKFRSWISGGSGNVIEESTSAAFIGAGANNRIGEGYGSVTGGFMNTNNGLYSTIGGGLGNSVLFGGAGAFVAGGIGNIAAAQAGMASGRYAHARLEGQEARANDRFLETGDGQASTYTLYLETADSAPAGLRLLLSNPGARLSVAPGQTMAFEIMLAARTIAGQSAGYQFRGVIKNVAGNTVFTGAPSAAILGEDVAAWDAAVIADDVFDALVVRVIGEAGVNIRWVATVRTSEVKFGP